MIKHKFRHTINSITKRFQRFGLHRKFWFLTALVILAVITPIILLRTLHPGGAEAEWFNDSWSFRQKAPINNTSGSNQTDFQVQVTLDTAALLAAGKIQADCDDLRFTNQGGDVLAYWLEPTTCNTNVTKVWVKVPTLHTTGTDIFVYYGNPSANSESSTTETFIRDMDGAVAAWPLDDTLTTQSYSRVVNPAVAVGRDIVINGGFDADASWTKGTGWTIADGVAVANPAGGNAITQVIPLIKGKTYQVTYSISNYSIGQVWFSDGTFSGTHRYANGTYTESFTNTGSTTFYILGDTFTGDIDNVSVKQLSIPAASSFTGAEMTTNGDFSNGLTNWTQTVSPDTAEVTGGRIHIVESAAAYAGVLQAVSFTAGKTYRMIADYEVISGTLRLDNSIGFSAVTGTGKYDAIFIATTTGNSNILLRANNTPSEFYVDNVSVIEVDPLVGKPLLGVTLGAASGGHLTNAYSFDGTNDNVNIYSSDLNSVFNPSEGTLVAWAKVANSGVWSDNAQHKIIYISFDGSNFIELNKNSSPNNSVVGRAVFGGVTKRVDPILSTTDWFQIVMTWSKSNDQLKVFINGNQSGTTQTGLGTWVGNLTSTTAVIGAQTTAGASPWSGLINDVRLYNRALSAEEIADQYNATVDHQAYTTSNYPGKELIRKYNTGVTVGSSAAEEVGAGPVAYWKFDEGTGQNVQDSSSKRNNGTLGATSGSSTDDPSWVAEDQCVSGKCLKFDGGDYVLSSTSVGTKLTGGYSFSVWIKPTVAGDDTQPVGIISNGGAPTLQLKASSFRFFPEGSSNYDIGSYELNKWYYITAVYDNTHYYFYINGILVASGSDATGTPNDSDNYFIGSVSTSRFFTGFMDEIKIYPYARTAAQVKEDFNLHASKIASPNQRFLSDGLVGYWKMDETSGTAVADVSGNANTGTLTNAQETGTSDATGNSTTTLIDGDSASLSTTDDAYNGMVLNFTAVCGSIASGTQRIISDYTGATKTFTVGTALAAAPDNCAYSILHQVGGKFGSGLQFDGANDYVNIGDKTTLKFNNQNFSVFTWVYADRSIGAGSYSLAVAKSSSALTAKGYYLGRNGDTKALFGIRGSTNTELKPTGSFSLNAWHQIGLIVKDGQLLGYVDGSQVGSTTLTMEDWTSGTRFDIGGAEGGYLSKDKVDEVRVYNRALSPTEVTALYNWAPGPVAWYTMDEKSGTSTIKDSSTYGQNLTQFLTTASSWVEGKYGSALKFDGTTQHLRADDSEVLSPGFGVTMTAWIKADATPGDPGKSTFFSIAQKDGGYSGAPVYGLRLSSAMGINAHISYGSAQSENYTLGSGSSVLQENQWYFVAMTYDQASSSLKSYVNGKLENSASYAVKLYDSSGASGYLRVALGDNRYFSGSIDDVKIYNYARTQAQILQDMQGEVTSNLTADTAGGIPEPIAHYKFDEQQGQTAANSVANGSSLNGTLGVNSSASTDDPTWKTSSSCKNNGCLSFDGGDYVIKADDNAMDLTSAVSLSAWVNFGTLATSETIIAKRDVSATEANYAIRTNSTNSDELSFYFYANSSWQIYSTSNADLQNDTWYHILATYDGSTVKIYVNGVLKTGTCGTGTCNMAMVADNNSVAIGKAGNYSEYLTGLIDDVKIYNFALTADQVKQDFAKSSSVVLSGNNEEAQNITTYTSNSPPVAQWEFEEKQGANVSDTSGNSKTGTITGATWKNGCKYGSCLYFDGSGDDVNFSDAIYATNLTIEAWVNFDRVAINQRVISKWGPANGDQELIITTHESDANELSFAIRSSTSAMDYCYTNSNVYTAGTWVHVVGTYDGTRCKIYINGADQTVVGLNDASGNIMDSNINLRLGVEGADGTTAPMTGKIDEVKIYNYARNAAQVAYDYNRGKPLAFYKFNECEGETIHDSSGNNLHGTLTIGASSEDSVGTCNTTSTAWGSGASGKYGASMSFDGSDDYVNIPSNIMFNTDTQSWSFWLKTDSSWSTGNDDPLNRAVIVSRNDATASRNGFALAITPVSSGGTIEFGAKNNGSDYPILLYSTTNVADNQWHHVVVVFSQTSGQSAYFYVDGKLEDSDTTASNWNFNTQPIRIGADTDSYWEEYKGQVDDLKVFNYALSAQQVKKEFNQAAVLNFR